MLDSQVCTLITVWARLSSCLFVCLSLRLLPDSEFNNMVYFDQIHVKIV